MTENRIQQEIFNWFNNSYCLRHHKPKFKIFSVPNGGKRDVKEAMTLKRTGLVSGVSDLIVLFPKKCLFVEVKTETGILSDKQKKFRDDVELLGFEYIVVRSLKDFQEKILLIQK